jgi:hypothetical protein
MLELYLVLGGLMNTCQYGFIYAIIHVMQEYFMPVNRNMERPPRKTEQPQDIWLCLGLIIRELGVRYALPDKGWGLTVHVVWTCSGVGVGLAKTRYSSESFIRCTDQAT